MLKKEELEKKTTNSYSLFGGESRNEKTKTHNVGFQRGKSILYRYFFLCILALSCSADGNAERDIG